MPELCTRDLAVIKLAIGTVRELGCRCSLAATPTLTTLWGDKEVKPRGRMLLEFLTLSGMQIANRGSSYSLRLYLGESLEVSLSDHRHIFFGLDESIQLIENGYRNPRATQWDLYLEDLKGRLIGIPSRYERQTLRDTWRASCEDIIQLPSAARLSKVLTNDPGAKLGAVSLPDGGFTSSAGETLQHCSQRGTNYWPRHNMEQGYQNCPVLLMLQDRVEPTICPSPKLGIQIPSRDDWDNINNTICQNGIIWFTDGSKIGDKAGANGKTTRTKLSFALGSYARVFQAEIYAILACRMEILKTAPKRRTIQICTDSQVDLMAIESSKVKSRLVLDGVPGNEEADRLARLGSIGYPIGPEPILGIFHKKRGRGRPRKPVVAGSSCSQSREEEKEDVAAPGSPSWPARPVPNLPRRRKEDVAAPGSPSWPARLVPNLLRRRKRTWPPQEARPELKKQ
ncbi:hypothetical protein NQ318_012883 [Aromia moschata]|uniref:RNase H type-1 domain-containing protein n=1 Tax=Aromia moschata TaxID=1265417 RepID=A0AAV8YCX3_9CUCU|nr:hypothetical protein NQ318_012883 [Aromia moschata]